MANPPGWGQKAPTQIARSKISNKARVNLKPEQFNDLIKSQGVRVRVYRTVLCPNVKSLDGAEHELDCQVCKQSGFLDSLPIDTWAYISSQTLNKAGQPEGMVDQCSGVATFLTGVSLQYFALVEVPDFQDTFFERVKRQVGAVDILKYRATTINVLTDKNGQSYGAGNDFNLDPNGNIQWIPGRGPDAGTIYSIHYAITLQFRAIHAMHVNRFGQSQTGANIAMIKMPEQWALEKVYLADRRDFRGDRLAPNLIRDSDSSDT